ncbi:hypothetical protein SCP_1001960 [Sparassis crispa]|uniref:Ribonucleases P/MRP subunit Pop8-like domain-containing protein n=1 Tax=Sparassis crispa TaxID=139825 RepID=A0A401GXN5_9APHY|nr:hypothetical protein SCP_1001960 [Sparassis crispa]GBE86952.1 hypothetical protein SCP_1001960 [Sparassis crispa]
MSALSTSYHYIRFTVTPPCADAVILRKALQDSLSQSFGLVSSNTYIDVLSISDNGTDLVIRVAQSEAARVVASVAAHSGLPRLAVVKESSFLPSLLSVGAIS